jgi:CBS domain-containing protein
MKSSVPISALLHHKGTALWSITPELTVFEAIKLMAEKNIGALLVISGGKLVGVVTERDYTRKIALQGKKSKETPVAEILSSRIVSVTPQHTVEECMKLMTEHRVRHLPVLENEKVTGIVSIGDLVNWTISAQDAAIAQMEQYIAGGVAA